jgi:hypothetical protein
MDKPNVVFDVMFMKAVGAGWGLTVAGALLLLVAGVWYSWANRERTIDRPPAGFRPIVAVGIGLFLFGLVWQFVGYGVLGAATFDPISH